MNAPKNSIALAASAAADASSEARRQKGIADQEPDILQVLTLVLWLACVAVGLLSMAWRYPAPAPPPVKPLEPVQAELIKVDLPPPPPQPLKTLPPPPMDEKLPPLPANAPPPPLPMVAAPSPAIAFALPVEGQVRIVGAGQAGYARYAAPVRSRVQRLIYGVGEGVQPKPGYPVDAQLALEEGSVDVRMYVAEDGHVIWAKVMVPSPWPSLNQAAVTAIRDTWRFRTGPRRYYEVVINYHFNQD